MLQKFAPDFWGILTPPRGGRFLGVLKPKTGVFLEFVGESLPRWYFRGQRYKAPLKGYRCFFGPAVGGLTEKSCSIYVCGMMMGMYVWDECSTKCIPGR